MSRYATSRVMWEVTRDAQLAQVFRDEPAAVLDRYELTQAELRALADQDIRALFELGIHPFILFHFALRMAGGNSLPFMQSYVATLQGLTTGDLET